MNAAGTLALDVRALEKDAEGATSVSVKCSGCDPDNPKSVPRAACQKCRGTGRCSSAVASIARDLHRARLSLLRQVPEEEVEDY